MNMCGKRFVVGNEPRVITGERGSTGDSANQAICAGVQRGLDDRLQIP